MAFSAAAICILVRSNAAAALDRAALAFSASSLFFSNSACFLVLASCLPCSTSNALARLAASASNLARRLACSSLDTSEGVLVTLGVGVTFRPTCAPTKPSNIFLGKFFRFLIKVGIAPTAPPAARVTLAIAVAIVSIT